MRGPSLIASVLALTMLGVLLPPAEAAVAPCDTVDFLDPSGDVASNPNAVPNAVNGFDRLDLRGVCFTEDADAVLVVVTVGAAPGSTAIQSYSWTFHFKADNGTDETRQYTHANGQAGSAPAGMAEADGTRIQFKILKSAVAPGTPLGTMFIQTNGEVVDQGNAITGTDRAPDGTASFPFTYKVGARAPPGTDTDGDGVEDSVEVSRGTDPQKEDTDGDGLSDQAEQEAGSDPTKSDTDGDGLTDKEEVGGRANLGGSDVTFSPTDPTLEDTDGDGLSDREELTAARNSEHREEGFIETIPGSTDPNEADTDGDGLGDGDELGGSANVDGETVTFAPSDPTHEDTDHDGLTDLEEVRGYRVTPNGQRVDFSATDPTQEDSDGDGVNDFQEVQQGHDPQDASDRPTSGPASDVAQYLPISAALLLIVVLVSVGGIFWRWA